MAKQRTTLSKIARFRLRFTFWLDINKPDEHVIAELVEDLKINKLFVKTVRDGIRLICSLRDGRLDVLFELFPWVREEMEKGRAQQPINAIEAQLARLEKLMEQSGGAVVDATPKSIGASSGPRPLAVPSFAMPQFDDDDQATVIIKKSTNMESAQNFVNGVKALLG